MLRRRRRNPAIGTHPDLFVGESRIYVPLDELTNEEIVKMPRHAFDDFEWEELDDELQEAIYENSEVDKERAEYLAKLLDEAYEWTQSEDAYDASSEMDAFESWLNDLVYRGQVIDVVSYKHGDEIDEIIEQFTAEGHEEEDVEEALKQALEDQNNWDESIEQSNHHATYAHELLGSVYIEKSHIQYHPPIGSGWVESDIDAAMRLIESDIYIGSWEKERLWKVLDPDGERYATFEIDSIESGLYFVVEPNWGRIREQVADELGEVEEKEDSDTESEEEATPPEERVFMRLPDGFYVLDLLASELPEEGSKQGICVGQAQYGYGRAVRAGTTKILSLRRPAGKPLLTFEVAMDGDTPTRVVQIKGKGNRLPGWDRGGTGQGQVKAHEVMLAKQVVEELGLVPSSVTDLRPGLDAVEGRLVQNPPRRYRVAKTFSDPVG